MSELWNLRSCKIGKYQKNTIRISHPIKYVNSNSVEKGQG